VAVLLAGISALLYGGADFYGGLATRRSAVSAVLALSQFVGLAIALAAVAILRTALPAAADLAWGAVAGICGAAGLAALYTALARTVVAVASPVAAVVGTVIPVVLGVAAGERPGALAWAGIAVALPAIALLSAAPGVGTGSGSPRRAALLGTAAGTGFGLFFFAISRTTGGSGLWPLVAARVATIALVALTAAVTGRTLRPARGSIGVVVAAGALDMGANIAFLLASRAGMVSVAAAVAALYPGPTVLLAWIVLHERITPLRIVGLVFALAGVALISAGQ
jgi:drug/metabolite transporter (DMT)-like permease